MSDLSFSDAAREHIDFLAECNLAMAEECESKRLDRGVLTRGVVAVLDRPERGLVAERDDQPIDGFLITLERGDWRNGGRRLMQSVNYGLCQRAFKALDQSRRADEPRESS